MEQRVGTRYEELKRNLLLHRKEAEDSLNDQVLRAKSDKTPIPGSDVTDAAEVGATTQTSWRLAEMARERIRSIDAALRRLEEGQYGNCRDCGEEIADKRLLALPHAVRCIDCEEIDENSHGSNSDRKIRGFFLRHT